MMTHTQNVLYIPSCHIDYALAIPNVHNYRTLVDRRHVRIDNHVALAMPQIEIRLLKSTHICM